MWEHTDSTAIDGLRYLTFLGSTTPPVDAFAAYLEQPRPERKSLTGAVQASKAPSGQDILGWCERIGWVEVHDGAVTITGLGRTVVATVDNPGGGDLDAELEELVAGEQARETAVVTVDRPDAVQDGIDEDDAVESEPVES